MKVDINVYTDSLLNEVPHNMYVGLLSVLCLGIVLLLAWKRRRAWRHIAGLMLMEYSFFIYCSTVIYRIALPYQKIYLMPFWSYRAVFKGNEHLFTENIMNVVVFVPVGLLFGITLRGRNIWDTLMFGAGLSVGIEVLQFVFRKGFAEVDDVMHNTIGCVIGFGLYSLARFGYKSISKRDAVAH